MTTKLAIGIAKGSNRDRSHMTSYCCELEDPETNCPFYSNGHQCIEYGSFLSYGCVYGRRSRTTGHTKRAYKSYGPQMKRWKELQAECPGTRRVRHPHIAIVGDYIWLGAYPHIDMCEVMWSPGSSFYDNPPPKTRYPNDYTGRRIPMPFLAYGGAFRLGKPWMKTQDFTPKVAVCLARFRPQAMMGGEITDYQKKHVPRFLFHLRTYMPEIWARILELAPELEERLPSVDDILLKTVSIKHIPANTVVGIPNDRQHIPGNIKSVWDGRYLEYDVTPKSALAPTNLWSLPEDIVITIKFAPPPDYQVRVVDDKDLLTKLWEEGVIQV
ncbi:MAG: hypothetical protein GWN58_27875 [Anaerolineae bacterium]|nr:hypothetical protein [Anaerolineae bacterium]